MLRNEVFKSCWTVQCDIHVMDFLRNLSVAVVVAVAKQRALDSRASDNFWAKPLAG